MINELLKTNDFFYIIGHKNPDVDSIVSAVLLKDVFNHFNIKCDYALLEGDYPDDYNTNVINSFLKYNPVIIKEKDIKKNKYFLVDHNDISQSINDLNLVIGSIDHHHNAGYINNIIYGEYCSNALLIYSLFKDIYNFNETQKKSIYIAFLMDSKFTMSSRYKEKDKKLVQELGYNKYFEQFFKQYFIPTDINKKDIFYNNGYKNYTFKNVSFESSYIESLNTDLLENYKYFVKNYNNNFLGIWYDYSNNKTYIFFNYKGKLFEYIFDYIASRGSEIIKKILIIL